jgi:protein TonB
MSQRNVKDSVSQWLIHHAARRAPQSLSERLEEEWLADLTARPSALSRLRFALGCCWATQVITLEFQPTRAPIGASGATAKHLSVYAGAGLGNFSGRSGTLLLVVSLHALVFYGLLTAITRVQPSPKAEPLTPRVLDDPRPPKVLPPYSPTLDRTPIVVQRPEFPLLPPEGDQIQDAKTGPSVDPTPPQHMAPHLVTQVQGGPGSGFPTPDEFYPSLSRRLGEQGIATVQVCVDAKGRLTSEPITVQGSGSARLDAGALEVARAGSGHYRATTQDGQPVNSCYPFRVRFQLRN